MSPWNSLVNWPQLLCSCPGPWMRHLSPRYPRSIEFAQLVYACEKQGKEMHSMWYTGKRDRLVFLHEVIWGFGINRKLYTIKQHCWPCPSLSIIIWAPGGPGRWPGKLSELCELSSRVASFSLSWHRSISPPPLPYPVASTWCLRKS